MSRKPSEFLYALVEKTLFNKAPGLYRALYSAYKALSDARERRVYRQFIQPGMTVADIGANIGIYSAFFADLVGAQGLIHAFEPEQRNFRLLEKALGNRQNVTLNQLAVGPHSETLFLHISADLNVDHRMYNSGEGRATIPVECVALDDYFAPGARVDFIKMDIQGFEVHALRGMSRVLAENPQVKLLLEYFPAGLEAAGSSPAELRTLLEAAGFKLFALGPSALAPLGENEPPLGAGGYTNLFAQH